MEKCSTQILRFSMEAWQNMVSFELINNGKMFWSKTLFCFYGTTFQWFYFIMSTSLVTINIICIEYVYNGQYHVVTFGSITCCDFWIYIMLWLLDMVLFAFLVLCRKIWHHSICLQVEQVNNTSGYVAS